MDFRDNADEAKFRTEVRGFIATEYKGNGEAAQSAAQAASSEGAEGMARYKQWMKKLAAKGWVAAAWPKEYGGAGMSIMEQFIFNEELAIARAPRPGGIGITMAGPTIIVYGNDDQKREHLPPMLAGDSVWCQGFSEPGAGSDLASLQTKATLDGDHFVVNGQKIWTSLAHNADWCVLLVRTDADAPKHKGISYLLVDMTNRHAFNQIFFEDVRVPRDCLIGEMNRGWYVAAATLDFERSGINRVVAGVRVFEELVDFAREKKLSEGRPEVRTKLAELSIELSTGRLLAYRVASMQQRGQIPNAEASMSKMYGSELQQRIAGAGMQIIGLAGQLETGRWAPLTGRLEQYYLTTSALTVAAGTTEIQKNIIAGRGLGLPRD